VMNTAASKPWQPPHLVPLVLLHLVACAMPHHVSSGSTCDHADPSRIAACSAKGSRRIWHSKRGSAVHTHAGRWRQANVALSAQFDLGEEHSPGAGRAREHHKVRGGPRRRAPAGTQAGEGTRAAVWSAEGQQGECLAAATRKACCTNGHAPAVGSPGVEGNPGEVGNPAAGSQAAATEGRTGISTPP
jgi:hypothetical protein